MANDQPNDERLPVAVITGFLGSGKSTLLNRLLKHPDMADTAVIVNEFGEVGIDHALIEGNKEDTVLLSSGCLCCTVRGDLVNTLRDLFVRRVRGEIPEFKRVVVETTGLADPAPIVHTLMTDQLVSARYRLDGVISTVDAVNGTSTLNEHMEAVKQAAVADRIVLTKTDMPEAGRTDAAGASGIERRLQRLNPGAPLHIAVKGEIEPALLFNTGLYDPETKSADVRKWLKAESYADDHHHEHHAHDVNRHDEHISSFCLTFDEPFDWNQVATWLDLLAAYRGENLLRVKGLLNIIGSEQPVVIHGVQHLFHPPATLPAWPDDDRRSRIVFITKDLSRETIEGTLKALRESQPAAATATAVKS